MNAPWHLPFFETHHRELADSLTAWVATQQVDERDVRAACREWVDRLGRGGWLRLVVPQAHGGVHKTLDTRSLVIVREILAGHSTLADFAFAMQGLGSGAITLAGTPAQQSFYLPKVAQGQSIAAFALSEPQAGSDVAGMQTSAQATQDGHVLNGVKTWISNGGMADFYVVFAKTDASAGARGISAFIVDASQPGLDDSDAIEVMSPHPLATLRFHQCHVRVAQCLGPLNKGFALAMQTLDIFRASVAAAALGMGKRALQDALSHTRQRRMFGSHLADLQLTQARLGEMASSLDSAALMTYRAAWWRDTQGSESDAATTYTRHAAMAKLCATEQASRVIDMALQMHGGLGVLVGQKIESLYRDIRALRIYEGASEVQQLIIGKSLIRSTGT